MTFEPSMFPPIALGFFGLGIGYLVWGPQELFDYPPRDEAVDRSVGMWGFWLAGFAQLVTGVILFLGLTLFQVFTNDANLYMAALAFSAYGIHWFVLGWNRYRGNDPRPNAGMAVGFTILSALGAVVFFSAGTWAVGVLFALLVAVYVTDFGEAVGISGAKRGLGLSHVVTGLWLMYLTVAVVLNFAVGTSLPA